MPRRVCSLAALALCAGATSVIVGCIEGAVLDDPAVMERRGWDGNRGGWDGNRGGWDGNRGGWDG
ncbi:MAG: hypothetical protein KJZ91_02440, partial [Myxococcales bacterium]|nr:hypothetical protein [Myxococcales bacterium]